MGTGVWETVLPVTFPCGVVSSVVSSVQDKNATKMPHLGGLKPWKHGEGRGGPGTFGEKMVESLKYVHLDF